MDNEVGGTNNGNHFWLNSGGSRGVLENRETTHSDTSLPAVPGPLPILGSGIAFGYARFLRLRVRSNQIVPGSC